jgi:hypothetical protein
MGAVTNVAEVVGNISFYEDEVVAGGKTISIELTDDTWVASGATFDAQRQNIINGLDSAQSELNGWNNTVRDVIGVGTVVRTSDVLVTVTLPATAGYSITAGETITVSVPATAVTSGSGVTATPTLSVVEGNAPTDVGKKKKFIPTQA